MTATVIPIISIFLPICERVCGTLRSRKSKSKNAIEISSESISMRSCRPSFVPLTNVPLLLLRSRIQDSPFSVMRISAWNRETTLSLMTISLAGAEPIRIRALSRRTSSPSCGPFRNSSRCTSSGKASRLSEADTNSSQSPIETLSPGFSMEPAVSLPWI